MNWCKFIFPVLCLMALTTGKLAAQNNDARNWRELHYLSEEEMLSPNRDPVFCETDPPTGEVRFPAEFEPMQAVIISYPVGIPYDFVRLLSERAQVYVLVESRYENGARYCFQYAGCNMENISFFHMTTDSYWVRDFGPWFIFDGLEPAIVDNAYNRDRPNDNMVPVHMGEQLGLTVYGMSLTHTGGNMMEDGRGIGVSDDLVLQENNNDEATVRSKMHDYLGIDPYHITIDPQGDYIAHVDCWGKFLAPDKILIARLPQSDSQYDEYEQVAEYFANTNCCWGYPYKVYRVDEPGGDVMAPYTNSLIVNNTVFVPLGTNSIYNQHAIQVYQEAMPGYEIIGVLCDYLVWYNTDALHCRTRGVMDFDMLFVDHRDVIYGTQAMQDSIAVTSKFIAYSGEDLIQDSLLVYYSIDGGSYQAAHMTATGNPNEYVGYIKGYTYSSTIDYYVYGADESGHRYSQPSYGALEPHHFVIEDDPGAVRHSFTLHQGWNWWSTYVTSPNLLQDLEEALDGHGICIQSQNGMVTCVNGNWRGNLNSIEVGKMYKIQTDADITTELRGHPVNLLQYPISICEGSNWIGLPFDYSISLKRVSYLFNPIDGDVIKDSEETAVYYRGTWYGSLKTLYPGTGYLYQSNERHTKTWMFPTQ